MRHFPIFLDLHHARVLVAGSGEVALAKLRLLTRTPARLELFAPAPAASLLALATEARLTLHLREIEAGDLEGARLVYAASGDPEADARTAGLARAAGVLLNVVDDLGASDFITPALVDRDPVVVAIGTEGTAPVLARKIKAEVEASLPVRLGELAEAARPFRPVAASLPHGRPQRAFWSEYYGREGPRAQSEGKPLAEALAALHARHAARAPAEGRVDIVGAGPGDPELLTLKARRLLDAADVVVHDALVPAAILELARREARFIAVGKEGFGPSTPQAEIHEILIREASQGLQVLRLKGGDPAVFARLDEETEALDTAGIDWQVVPGITAASAAAAATGRSLTRRGRNTEARLISGHDSRGFADHDWAALARPGAVAAIYMGKRAARFIGGRLLMHGASGDTPVAIVENAARPEQRVLAASLAGLADTAECLTGPAILLLGITPRAATLALLEAAE